MPYLYPFIESMWVCGGVRSMLAVEEEKISWSFGGIELKKSKLD